MFAFNFQPSTKKVNPFNNDRTAQKVAKNQGCTELYVYEQTKNHI